MAITVIEHTATPVTGTATSLSATKTLTAGSTVLVFLEGSSVGVTSPTCADNNGGSYTERQSITDATTIKTWCWSAGNVTGGSTQITVSGLAGYSCGILIYELTGADAVSTTSSYDASDSVANTVSSSPIFAAQASGITVASGATAFAFYRGDRSMGTLTWTGSTAGTDSNRSTIAYYYPRWKAFAGGASGERASASLSSSSGYTTGILISIKEAAGGGSSSVPPKQAKLLLGVG